MYIVWATCQSLLRRLFCLLSLVTPKVSLYIVNFYVCKRLCYDPCSNSFFHLIGCKPGWIEFQNKCYWFSKATLDWYRASVKTFIIWLNNSKSRKVHLGKYADLYYTHFHSKLEIKEATEHSASCSTIFIEHRCERAN